LLKILIFLGSFFLLIIIFEIIINIFFSKILNKNKFNFDKIIKKDSDLGWKQKNNKNFFYYHRYLKNSKKIFLKTNNLGIIDSKDYLFDGKKQKVAIFGDNSISGFDTKIDSNFITLLRKKIKKSKKNIDIYNFTNRDYCTLQYFKYYEKFLKKIKFDLIIYIYSHNHSRRNITIHESTKSKIFTQPLYDFRVNKKISFKGKFLRNDNIFLNKNNQISIFRAKKSSIKFFFYDRLYFFSIIYDAIVGKNKLKKMDFIHEIKNIENQNLDYHWEYTFLILKKWKLLIDRNKTKFAITNIPSSYHNPNNHHQFSFKISQIKERKKIKFFCKNYKIRFYDNYKSGIKKFYKSNFFIHPRYAYLNTKGYDNVTDRVFNIIKSILK